MLNKSEREKKVLMYHLKDDALIFCVTYGIESLRVCGWSYECVFITY